MKKVLAMTLNPCIDRTIYLESFQVGETNIVKKVMEEAAGKGINVAIGLQHLQVPVKALGFAYKEDKAKLYGKLDAEQIPYTFVEVDGRLRVNQKLFDESKAEMTECNEKGGLVTKEDIDKLLVLLQNELQDASILVLSGSVPPGVDSNIYAVMISMANEANVKVILDASGELLKLGIEAKPYLIKPNLDEFVKTFMKSENDMSVENEDKTSLMIDAKITRIAEELISKGLSYICLSLGADGAVLMRNVCDREEMMSTSDDNAAYSIIVEKRPAISVPIRSLQGAGDAMVAGLCKAIFEESEDRMLDYALSMSASTIMLDGTAMGNGKLSSKCK